jgi:hypothetical protein
MILAPDENFSKNACSRVHVRRHRKSLGGYYQTTSLYYFGYFTKVGIAFTNH